MTRPEPNRTNPCRSRTRFKTESSAASAWKVTRGGFRVAPGPCPHCAGWHIERATVTRLDRKTL